MAELELYERRTYDVNVGQMGKVLELYSTEGWPALEAGGHSKFLVGYFVSDTGPLHQLIHLWRFSSDAERRSFWADDRHGDVHAERRLPGAPRPRTSRTWRQAH